MPTRTAPPGYDKLRSIDVVIPPVLQRRLRPYVRATGATRYSDYVRYCVGVTSWLIQLVKSGHSIVVVTSAGEQVHKLQIGTRELGQDATTTSHVLESFDL
jgi:hypothetical protein